MKTALLAAALALALAAPAFAQMYPAPTPERKIEATPEKSKAEASATPAVEVMVEQPKCEDPGPYPGRMTMGQEDRRNKFQRALESYTKCMQKYVVEREATMIANQKAGRLAVEAFNARVKEIKEAQDKDKQ
jgi:hypothetical protein